MKRLLVPFVAALSPAFILILGTQTSQADSATWKTSPATGDWNHAANWTPPTIPNGPSDTATFATSNTTNVSISANTEVNGIVFNAGASAFTITATPRFALTISGVGITNNSGIPQNLTAVGGTRFGASIRFLGDATAGNLTAFTNNGGTVSGAIGGFIRFSDRSTAGNGTFTNNGGAVDHAFGGTIGFYHDSTAGNGTFINNGSPVIGGGGYTLFFQSSTAGNATLIANGNDGGEFGPSIFFHNDSRGGTARVKVFGTGLLDISAFHTAPGVTIGSIEGDGNVFLGGVTLTVGSNNLSTRFSGVIQDGGGGGGTGGSLSKIGTGVLILDHRNTYTGGTTINGGKLVLNNKNGSGTGTGPVQVNRGRLGGRGTIAGDVTVGDGSGRGAALSPGNNAVTRGTLTIQSTLTFNSDATYNFWLNTSDVTADEVVALGVTINSGAQFSFADLGNGTLTPGTVFTVINDTAATPIAGTFSNLPDGSIFTSNGNTYQVSYQGGDGNDLTLTVIP